MGELEGQKEGLGRDAADAAGAGVFEAFLEAVLGPGRRSNSGSGVIPLGWGHAGVAAVAEREAYNRTGGPLPSGLLHAPFFTAAAATPERTAVVTPGRTLSYGELAARAGGIARRLTGLDVRPNDLVAVVMEKGWEQCAAVLGILAAGAAYLPIDPELPDERVRLLLEHGQARAVLTQGRVAQGREDRFDGVQAVFRVDELPLEEDAADANRSCSNCSCRPSVRTSRSSRRTRTGPSPRSGAPSWPSRGRRTGKCRPS
ncbi:AMP-binding protein [Streptomyces tuirus]|uniref:AMP-dependent synthetase/ligase domain-containing protein n=1 Tax=Streptomyces tuirus TaxID=68278 RepID=A0A7G1NFS9_9ACTN|nr:AMP-binding protein [Streptomyces tuirus]BCL21689.1 hypothetical protein GCM10017668_35320 [Streptomyces tuirus]